MVHGLETIKSLNDQAVEDHKRRSASKMSPAMRERGVQRLLAAIDLAIAQRDLNPRSIIADARLDLGGIMDITEAQKTLWPNGRRV